MTSLPRTGLQKKFFIALLIAGIVPGIVALVATYLFSIDSLKHSIGSSFQEIARSAALRISSAVDMEIDRAVQLAAAPILVRWIVELSNQRYHGKSQGDIKTSQGAVPSDPLKAQVTDGLLSQAQTIEYLKKWTLQDGHYVRVIIADSQGVLVASNDPQAPPLHAKEQWWREAVRGDLNSAFVSSLKQDTLLNELVFEVAVPIPNENYEKPIGAVGLIIRRDVLMDTILPIHVGETGHGMLMDTAGTPLVCPVLPPTGHLIQNTLINLLARDQPQWLVVDDDAHGGRDSIIGVAPVRFAHKLSPLSLGGSRWFAFVRQHPDETYAPIYSLLLTVGLIGFALVVVLASLGFAVGRRIVGPILTLRREADTLRRDIANLSQGQAAAPVTGRGPIEIKTGDEIEELAHTFNAMRRALDESLHTVTVQHDELIRKEKLASVGQLLAALAHDLRNPLGVIRSSAQLVLEERQSEAVKQEVTRYIIEEVDKLTHRINDFLRYARQKPPEPKRIAAEMIAQAALRQWKAQGGHERLTIITCFAAALPDLCVDPEQVKEALVNLLINAREAMPDGGQLTLTTRRDEYGGIAVVVADTGGGISKTDLRRIFEPFYTTKEYGTGLGLTNVKRLVEDNRGTIEVESEKGQGSRFIIRFPVADTSFQPHTTLELESGSG
jgi:signal transduction histidine kinase